MKKSFKNKDDLGKNNLRQSSDSEMEEFRNKINNVSELSSETDDRESGLIESYLKGELNDEDAGILEIRIKTDEEFAKKVTFLRSLHSASKDIRRRKEIRNQLDEIKTEIEQEKTNGTYQQITKQERRIRTLIPWAIMVSVAASITLLLLILPPNFERQRISKFMAYAEKGKPKEINILDISSNNKRTTDSSEILHVFGVLKITYIEDNNLKDKYFIKDRILFTCPEDHTDFKAFIRISSEGRAEYYLCKGIAIYGFSVNKENKILKFRKVTDPDLMNLCH
jgi:hypothetical protein